MKLLHKKPYLVWHNESPGMKLIVFRNWFQLKLFGCFHNTLEKDYYYDTDLSCAIDLTQD